MRTTASKVDINSLIHDLGVIHGKPNGYNKAERACLERIIGAVCELQQEGRPNRRITWALNLACLSVEFHAIMQKKKVASAA
jgi:hypothetical protein